MDCILINLFGHYATPSYTAVRNNVTKYALLSNQIMNTMLYPACIITLYACVQAGLCAIISTAAGLVGAHCLWRYHCVGYTFIRGMLMMFSCMPTKAAALAIYACH